MVYLGCLVELQNALCPLSYELCTNPAILALLGLHGITASIALIDFDFSEMSHELRLECIYCRGRMVSLLRDHVFRKYRIRDANGDIMDPWSQLFIPTLAHLICALKAYFTTAFDGGYSRGRKAKSTKSVIAAESLAGTYFKVQLKSTSRRWEELDLAVKAMKVKPTTLFPTDVAFTVEKLDLGDEDADGAYPPAVGNLLTDRDLNAALRQATATLTTENSVCGLLTVFISTDMPRLLGFPRVMPQMVSRGSLVPRAKT